MANSEKAIINLMQVPEDFWAFKLQLTNSRLFQQKVMPALHDSDVSVT